MKTTKKKQEFSKLDRGDFHHLLHRGLRKGCDSGASSLLWNLVYVTDDLPALDKAWNTAVDILFARYTQNPEKFFDNIREILDEIDWGDRYKNLVHCALEELDESDWFGLNMFFSHPY